MLTLNGIYIVLVNSLFILRALGGVIVPENSSELRIFKAVGDIVLSNYKDDGCPAILFYGPIPDEFYKYMQHLHLSYITLNSDYLSNTFENTIPYQINTVVLSCEHYKDFGDALSKITILKYWNPHAKIFLYIRSNQGQGDIAKIFYAFWWYQSLNVFILQHDELTNIMYIYNYTPYSYEGYELKTSITCWSSKRWTPTYNEKVIANYIFCEDECSTKIKEKYSRKKLPARISFNKRIAHLNKINKSEIIMQDLTANLHGFPLKAFGSEVPPFLQMVNQNGSFEVQKRDGEIWNTFAKNMNFTLQIHNENKFSYIKTTQLIFNMSYRGVDIVLLPIYQVDLIVTVVDLLFPYRASGVCIVAHRAGFETQWFDAANITLINIAASITIFIGVLLTFVVFKYFENNKFSFDQLGKDFCNTMRTFLIVTLHRPPRQESFRIYHAVSLWCFFVLTFILQASIVSFLTAVKRGKDVDTFKDIADHGYTIKGFRSPDMFLPETNEIYTKINSLQEGIENIYECVNALKNNTHLFCMLDCTLANYLEKNRLDSTGEPYMHVAKDKIHSLFLSMMMPWKSPLSRNMNKYLMVIFEAGLIKKWEDYRYDKIHEDGLSLKPISLSDLDGMFQLYVMSLIFTIGVFVSEVLIGFFRFSVKYLSAKLNVWRVQNRKLKSGKISVVNVNASTQTFFVV